MALNRDNDRYASARKRLDEHEKGFESKAIDLPEGVKQFRFKKAGTYRLDILPYKAGNGNQHADPGQIWYERTYYVHSGIGPEAQSYVCPAKTFHKKCPICEQRAKLYNSNGYSDALKPYQWKERQLFNVKDKDNSDDGIQIFETAYYTMFGELLDHKLQADEGYLNFFRLDGGMSLKVQVEQDSFAGKNYFKPVNIEMIPRKDLDSSILKETHCLDKILKETDYKKLKEIFEKGASDDDEEDNGKAEKEEDADDDDLDSNSKHDSEDSDDEPKKPKKKASSRDDDDSDEDDSETDDDIEDSDDDDEEEKDDDEEETVKKKVSPKKKSKK